MSGLRGWALAGISIVACITGCRRAAERGPEGGAATSLSPAGDPAGPVSAATDTGPAEPAKAEDAKGAVMPAASYAVLVYDNSEMGDEDAGHQVSGFPSFEVAKEYARRRVRASIEEVRTPGIAAEDLRRQWELFGESAQVVGGAAGEAYSGRDELDFFIAHPATDEESDWQAVARQAGAR